MMKKSLLFILCCFLVLVSCKKKEGPKTPEASALIFPNQDSECTTGESIDETTSNVEFRWQASKNTETYDLKVVNLDTRTLQTISTVELSAILPLDKGVPYSWVVVSKNTQVVETTSSETWRFYNVGVETTYAPFPAEIIQPKSGISILKDINNEIELIWSGVDIEDDIVGFDIFFDTNNGDTLVASLTALEMNYKVSVASGTNYYWRIVTRDAEGNSSDTGVFQFKAL